MGTDGMNRAIGQLRAVLLRDGAGLTDGQLLECYISRRDEAAFEALVRRHGPMVFGVCRRVLRHHQDSEDAFQATFLVLARKAGSIDPPEMVGNWLYGVAYRTALNAKRVATKRRIREQQTAKMPDPVLSQDDACQDLPPLLDQELSGLPEKYRAPLILCALQGKTEKEAARQLGWPQGTLSSRLSRAKAILATRLTRRGLVFSFAGMLSKEAVSACIPARLLDSTVKSACVGQSAEFSANVAALTKGVMTAMFFSRLKVAALTLLFVIGTALGTGTVVLSVSRAKEKGAQDKQAPAPPKDNVGEATSLAEIGAAYANNDALGAQVFVSSTKASRAAAMVWLTCCSVCTAERNAASN
jgi:RNA polymerase sigma-70 factor (ECF subfamily)